MPTPTNSEERLRLEQSIALLERQRAALGAAVVEPALAALRKQLAELEPQFVEENHHAATVLCVNIPGLVNQRDAALATALWQRLEHILASHGGHCNRQNLYEVTAIWENSEDAPERAIRSALAMLEEKLDTPAIAFAAASAAPPKRTPAHLQTPLYLRVGINTGPVRLHKMLDSGQCTADGEAVEIADRLQNNAQHDDILIAHETYRSVRGIFDVESLPPVRISGKKKPLQVYRVLRAKPRPFYLGNRGIEGVETRMIGRDAELQRLQQAYQETQRSSQSQMVTVIGEIGMGKSRLLYEFLNWLELNTDTYLFKGRAAPEMIDQAFSLLRNIFTFRFQINESNSMEVVREKMVQGMAFHRSDLEQRAHFIGQLLGFDFKDSPYIKGLLGDPRQLRERALAYVEDYLRTVAGRGPLVLIAEDIHWADEDSLDFLQHLPQACHGLPVMVLCAARPTLFERRQAWESLRLELPPLSRQSTLNLVDEMLQKVEKAPDALREMIAGNADGNPFYIEEMVKMLIEDGVIFKGEQRWFVNPSRMMLTRLPPTLTGILQARFDSLGLLEQSILQRASVLGRVFWDQAVISLAQPEPQTATAPIQAETTNALRALEQREMVFQREVSTFETANEYSFKHALLQEVIYSGMPAGQRASYHQRAAEWLAAHSGQRAPEMAGMIAEHLERGGQTEQAAIYLQQAGEQAFLVSAYRQARVFYERALHLAECNNPVSAALAVRAGESLLNLGNYPEASQQLTQALELSRQHKDQHQMAAALDYLGVAAREQGLFDQSSDFLQKSLEIARRLDEPGRLAHALLEMGMLDIRKGNAQQARLRFEESRTIYEQTDDLRGMAQAINRLGVAARTLGNLTAAQQYFSTSLEMCRTLNDLTGMARAHNNLGVITRQFEQYAAAQTHFQRCLEISEETGDQLGAMVALGNLGYTALVQQDTITAYTYYHQSLHSALEISAIPWALESLVEIAGQFIQSGLSSRTSLAIEIAGLVDHHPAANQTTREDVARLLENLHTQYSAAEIQAGMERGRQRKLENIIETIFNAIE